MARKVDPEAQKLTMNRFIDAGIDAIAKLGIDNVTVQHVSDLAKSSRPTFYSYFGDINGLLAEIWIDRAATWLAQISNPETGLTQLSKKNHSLHSAMSEILASSHRTPEVLEVVEPVMADWWKSFYRQPEMQKLRVMWLVAERLGVLITEFVDPLVHSAAFIEPGLIALATFEAPNLEGKIVLPKLVGSVQDSSTMDLKLLSSTIDVISRGGVKAASMSRVARRAQVSTGVVYPRFSGIESLVEQSFEYAIGGVVSENFKAIGNSGFSQDDFGVLIMAGLQPSREVWRNFRIEIHLGAKDRPSLSRIIQAKLRETNKQVATQMSAVKDRELASGPVPYLIHAVGIGFAILFNAGIPVNKSDHRVMTRALTQLINAR